MPKQKKFDNEIIYILEFLFKKRGELISPFLEQMNDWIGYTFDYERNTSAFKLVRDRFITLWIDSHFISLLNDGIPESLQEKALTLILDLIETISNPSISVETSNASFESSCLRHQLLMEKVQIIQEILDFENANTQNLKNLKNYYKKDKALFEREFEKYEKMISNESVI